MHGLLLIAVVVGCLIGLVKVEARAVRTVRHRLKLLGHVLKGFAVERASISVHHTCNVEGLLVSAFDLDGRNARRLQLTQVREHVHVLRVHDEGAAIVLLDGEMHARTLLLLERIAPAARLRAMALVSRTTRQIRADEATSGNGHAHGTMHEGLDLKVGRRLGAHAGNVVQAHLTRAHDAPCAQLVPHARGGSVGHRRLRAHMERHVRRVLLRQSKGAQVGNDERVNTRCINGTEELGQLIDVSRIHENVAGNVNLYACSMGDLNRLGDLIHREVRRTRTHTELVGSQIHRISAKANSGAQLLHAASGCQQFHIDRFSH